MAAGPPQPKDVSFLSGACLRPSRPAAASIFLRMLSSGKAGLPLQSGQQVLAYFEDVAGPQCEHKISGPQVPEQQGDDILRPGDVGHVGAGFPLQRGIDHQLAADARLRLLPGTEDIGDDCQIAEIERMAELDRKSVV